MNHSNILVESIAGRLYSISAEGLNLTKRLLQAENLESIDGEDQEN